MKIPDLRQDEKSVKDNGVADLDTAIKLTGFGKFNICLIAIGGMCFMGSGLEYGLHAYTLPYAKCDLKISTAQAGIVNAMFLAGSITCSVICGAVADTIGRKKVITTALFVGGISTILASFSPNLTMFAVVRFISGFMSGAPGCLIFSYAGEFLADKYRARAICTIGFCWTSAWLLSPLFSWIIIPSGLSFETPFFTYNTWRLFVVIVGGIPNIISGFAITYVLTETPKFLFVQGRQAEAIEILKMMYHKNTGNSPDEYPVKRLVSTYGTDLDDNSDASEANQKKSLKVVLLMMASQIKQIFNPPHLKRALLVSSIYFSNFFGYYGLGLWLPELFNRFQAYYSQFPEGNIGVCELSNYQNITMTSPANSTSLTEIVCENRSVNLAVFSNTFIIGAACCTGNLIAIFLTNKVGSRLLSVIGMFVAGLCAAIVYFSRTELQIVLVTCLFMAGVGTAMTTIGACIVNLFPTSVRAAGVCIGILFGRLGAVSSNLIFGLLLDISCEIPFFFLGGVIIPVKEQFLGKSVVNRRRRKSLPRLLGPSSAGCCRRTRRKPSSEWRKVNGSVQEKVLLERKID